MDVGRVLDPLVGPPGPVLERRLRKTADDLADALKSLVARGDRDEPRLSGASLLGAALSAKQAPFSDTEASQESTRDDDGTTMLSAGSERRPKATLQSTTAGAAVTDPEVAGASRVRRALPVALLGAALLVGAALLIDRPDAVEAPPSAAPEVERAPVASSFSLLLESVPAGARVSEKGRVLGVAPLEIAVERKAVLEAPRRFTLTLDGYEPYALSQGDSDANVRARAVLSRGAAAPAPAPAGSPPPPARDVKPRPAQGSRPRPEVKPPTPPPSATAPEIRLSR
jgi:hypothetical protein